MVRANTRPDDCDSNITIPHSALKGATPEEMSVFLGSFRHYQVGDLSTSDVLLTTEEKFPAGTKLELSFEVPAYKKPIVASGEVDRLIAKDEQNPEKAYGVGVKFVTFEGDSQSRLEKFVTKAADENNRMIYYL
jgi:hypothetical protein